jgi:hypothetical protein
MFPNQVVVADFEIAGLSLKLYILWFAPDYSMFEDPVALSESGIAANYCMGTYIGAFANMCVTSDDTIRPDGDVRRDVGR